MSKYTKFFNQLGIKDVPSVGGKNASLGEMYRKLTSQGVKVPNGFATTASAYDHFLDSTGLKKEIKSEVIPISAKDKDNLEELIKRMDDILCQENSPYSIR